MPRFADKPLLTALAGTEILAGTSVAGGGANPAGSVPAGADIKVTTAQLRSWIFGGTVALNAALNEAKGTDIASAVTTDIGAATGNLVHITGTTTITALGSVQAGTRRKVVFDGILILTHNATSLILPTGANITTAAGDTAEFISEDAGNWRCTGYQRASGAALTGALTEAVSALTISSGAITLDIAGKSRASFTVSLTANVTTVNLSNLAGAGLVTEFDLEIKQDGTGGRTFALPAAFKALGGSDTAIASAANAVTVLSAKTFDNGTSWRYAMQESA